MHKSKDTGEATLVRSMKNSGSRNQQIALHLNAEFYHRKRPAGILSETFRGGDEDKFKFKTSITAAQRPNGGGRCTLSTETKTSTFETPLHPQYTRLTKSESPPAFFSSTFP